MERTSTSGTATIAAQSVAGTATYSLPSLSSNDTLVSRTSTDTLTNKTLVTPVLGVATATSLNKVTITAPSTSATLTLANSSSLITVGGFSTTLTSTGTTNVTLPTTGTLATLAGTETLTNKTLTSPVISTIVNTGTLTLPTSTGTLLSNANPQSGGVLQVVQVTYSSSFTTTSGTLAATGMQASITPKFSTSKILVIVNHPECYKAPNNTENALRLNICRNGSQIVTFNHSLGYQASATRLSFSTSYTYLDSPATASAVTYKLQWFTDNTTGGIYLNRSYGDRNSTAYDARLTSQMIVMEVAG